MITKEQVPPIKVKISGSGWVRWPEGKAPEKESTNDA